MRTTTNGAAAFFRDVCGRIKALLKRNAEIIKHGITTAGVFCAAGVMAFAVGEISDSITIRANGTELAVYTLRNGAESILAQHFIDVGEHDEVLCNYDENGEISEIVINTAFSLTVSADGKTETVYALRGTVADALRKAGITLGELDTLNCNIDDEVFSGMEIAVNRVEKTVTVETAVIPYSTKYVDSTLLREGKKRVEREGVDGTKEITTVVTMVDGVEVDRKVTEVVLKRAVSAMIIVGSPNAGAFSNMMFDDLELDENGIPVKYSRVVVGEATAYGKNDGNITSTGTKPGIGYIAVNPKVIPYGSRLYIRTVDGKHIYGCAIAADTGPSVLKNKTVADVFLGTEVEIYYWGRKQVEIYILN